MRIQHKSFPFYYASFLLFMLLPGNNEIMAQEVHPMLGGNENGLIAFESEINGAGLEFFEVCLINPDGSGQLQLTQNAVYDGMPCLSPDGSKIAFISNRDGNYELYIMDMDGSNPLRQTQNSAYDFSPSWSPDGSKIAFCSYAEGNGDIYIMDSDGTNLFPITSDPADDTEPDWSPDGNQIAFSSTRNGGGKEIFTMNSNGSNQVQRTNLGNDNYQVDWSPDGMKLAFMTDSYTGGVSYDICTINIDGTNLNRLTDHWGHDEMPEWSPDGTKIAFGSSMIGADQIHVMNSSDGSNVQLVTNNPGLNFPHDWKTFDTASGINDNGKHPGFELHRNIPNPFINATLISYQLSERCHISLEIFDESGKWVKTIFSGQQSECSHEYMFYSKEMPGGLYYCKLTSQAYTQTIKMIIQ